MLKAKYKKKILYIGVVLFLFIIFPLWFWGLNPGPCADQETERKNISPLKKQQD
jgi:hypothetical protein